MTNDWTIIETTQTTIENETRTTISLRNGVRLATIKACDEETIVSFRCNDDVDSTAAGFYAIAEAARLLATVMDTIGDLNECDGLELATTVDANELISKATLRFAESAERIMLVAFFCEDLADIFERAIRSAQ